MAYVDPRDMQAFMVTHFEAINRLFDCFRLDESINEEISFLIGEYFYPKKT
jgi:hypothetical protein